MIVEKTIQGLRDHLKPLRDKKIALVPTMGNLHQGHLKLIEQAKQAADVIVVSIFVNPLQFSEEGDLANYPRTLAQDAEKLSESGVNFLFSPTETEMYPNGRDTQTQVIVHELSNTLCGLDRPGHFEGVATVVTKLFNIVQPNVALFGEKDYQQLQVIKACVRDLSIPVEIFGVSTARDENGLALSSRNNYLTEQQKITAPLIHQSIQAIIEQLKLGERNFKKLTQDAADYLKQHGFGVEYVEIRRQHDLGLPNDSDDELVILVAARLGKARLIDNQAIIIKKTVGV